MALYRYQAQTAGGVLQRGYMEAASTDEIIKHLKSKRLYPLKIKQVRRIGLKRGIPEQQLISFYQDLAGLLESGLSMDRALALSAANAGNKTLRTVLGDVLDSVRKGSSLSDAMANHPSIFGSLSINLVRAGELSGCLREVLERNAEHMERRREFKQKMISVMIYPTILFLVSLISILVLLVFVIPKFGQIFMDLDQEIPFVTSLLLQTGDWLREYSLVIPFTLLGLFITVKAVLSRPEARLYADRVMLKVPLLRTFILEAELSRFFRSLGVLLQGGVPILKSIGLVEQVVINHELQTRLKTLKQQVRSGKSISNFFSAGDIFPERVGNMLHIAEEQGALARGLTRLGDSFEREVQQKLERLATLAEPAVIILTGCFIGLTVLSMFSAIFGITDIQM